MTLDSRDVKIIAIVGMSGSGKSIAANYLTDLGYPKIHFGNLVRQEMTKRDIPLTPEHEKHFREMIRQTEGADWVVRQVIAELRDLISAGQKRIILDGVYSWTEYKQLKHEFPGDLTFIAMIASKPLRYERVAKRSEHPLDSAAIRERDRSEIEHLEKGGPIAAADYFVRNDGSLEDTYAQLKTILRKIDF